MKLRQTVESVLSIAEKGNGVGGQWVRLLSLAAFALIAEVGARRVRLASWRKGTPAKVHDQRLEALRMARDRVRQSQRQNPVVSQEPVAARQEPPDSSSSAQRYSLRARCSITIFSLR